MTNPTPLTQDELRAAAYFAVGVSSEGSIGGRDVSYRLSFAGNVGAGGVMQPVANSGYSFGTLQIDLGQHPAVARDLLDSYQQWAATQPDRATVELSQRQYANTLTALQRTGNQMRADGAVDIDRAPLNRFLASDAGRTFVHGLDTQHANGVTQVDAVRGNNDSALERLQATDLYRNAGDDEQARLAGMFMKLQNQSGNARWPGLIRQVEAGTLTSATDVKTAIDGMLRNQVNGNPDYLESGADNTLRGVTVFNALRNARQENPLASAWNTVAANPLMGPVVANQADPANPNRGHHYDTVRSLFLTPESSVRLIDALDRGASLAVGNPRPQQNGSRQAGFYVAGNDFVHWNRNGEGRAYINGQWREIDPDNLQRVANRDGTTALRLTENGQTTTLLHVDPRTPPLRPQAPAPVVPAPAVPAPAPAGTRHTLNDGDRQFVDTLRAQMGPGYSDAQVLATVMRAREAGFSGAQAIERSGNSGDAFFIRGDHTTGYATVRMGRDEQVQDIAQLQQASQDANAQRERARQAEMAESAERSQPRVAMG